ncbi:hypothetical protein [Pseudomonas sp. NBRC 111128]|uniref:hypothetical protein n=1 Tax=Pseudomonas sp. NBRC 111128 TaxID=1661043 RepID=UPI0006D4719A|nr:hypothetical protein [Pseudomonas sp. NBRC 111128]
MSQEKIRSREARRRKALWKLASLKPGHPEAAALIAILNSISLEEHGDPDFDLVLALEELRISVAIRRHPSGKEIVCDSEIPQPWRERFLQASLGSTRLVEGFYADDWKKFLREWDAEMWHLEAHKAATPNRSVD